ncbi:MAG: rhodanese-like domain-containing protein [Deltaproteobacteria bacterium]|nr:rhodanese-like domain-containing protein [Deltaproteobacteria bacterium]
MPISQTTPPEASALLQQGYRYIDVRTEQEFVNGHPTGALNIPVAIPDPASGQMALNPEFVSVVGANFPKDAKLILGCQAGGRSQRAAEMLSQAGFATVVNMQGGFGGGQDAAGRIIPGWAACGLPVSNDCPAGNAYSSLRAKAK